VTRYLVTSALPYANGPIHFGHAIGAYLPADVYVRTLRMQGEEVLYVCGADEHGVPITINAEKEGVPYSAYVARWREEMKVLFDRLGVQFDVWSGTSVSPPNESAAVLPAGRDVPGGSLRRR
jgi:methionyl-tRNA synthetase